MSLRAIIAQAPIVAFAAACSANSDGGIGKDPAASTEPATGTGTGPTSGSGTGTGTGTGAGGGAPSDQNEASIHAWRRLQGEFDSIDQQPINEEAGVPPPRRLLGCAVDAQELGSRVVYLERTEASEGAPDRQFLMSFAA